MKEPFASYPSKALAAHEPKNYTKNADAVSGAVMGAGKVRVLQKSRPKNAGWLKSVQFDGTSKPSGHDGLFALVIIDAYIDLLKVECSLQFDESTNTFRIIK
jgi:hypothetical protein